MGWQVAGRLPRLIGQDARGVGIARQDVVDPHFGEDAADASTSAGVAKGAVAERNG